MQCETFVKLLLGLLSNIKLLLNLRVRAASSFAPASAPTSQSPQFTFAASLAVEEHAMLKIFLLTTISAGGFDVITTEAAEVS